MMYGQRLKVGKIERYTYGISSWLNGETLTGATVTACGASFQINSSDFSGATIGFFAEGISPGRAELIISFETATRTRSEKVDIVIDPADVCVI